MIISAHQPHFLPWLGYFDKMRKADLFILLDHVQFERLNYQNRTTIKTGQGPLHITVPVRQQSRDEKIIDKLIDNNGDGRHHWNHRVRRSLELAYRGAPYFSEYAPPFFELLGRRWEKLVDLNIALLELCREMLAIRTPVLRSCELKPEGAKSELVLDICRRVGADVYLSGSGGSRKYLDQEAFSRAGLRIQWQEFTHPRYTQYPRPDLFTENVSVFDLLVNCGPESGAVLEGEPTAKEAAA